MKTIISYITIIVFIGILGFFAKHIYEDAINFEKTYIKISQQKDLNNNVEKNVKKVFASFLGALIGEKVKVEKKDNKLELEKKLYQDSIENNLKIYFAILLASLFLFFIIQKTIFLLYLNILALGNLILGVFTPIFLVYVQKNIPMMGNVMLQFESNTILSSIEKLFSQEKYFVGGIILLFSILFPILKTLLMMISIYTKNNILNKLTTITSYLSKWSMTDVFVLSIFLVYLSGSKSGMIHSEIEVGFYMFFTYVILSLISSIVYKKSN